MIEDGGGLPPAIYLRRDLVGLRAPLRADAGDASAWYEGEAPLLPDAAESLLAAGERIPWGKNPTIRLMIVELDSGEIVGSLLVHRSASRTSQLTLIVGERVCQRAQVQAEALRLAVPWLLNEVGLMTVTIRIPADETSMLDAAEGAGMRTAVRLREYVVRPGGRVDLLTLERVNEEWGRRWRSHDHA
jgi:RimJ/RimL family protein N-acetyltransferase